MNHSSWRPVRLLSPALLLACGSAFAQTGTVQLAPVVVTATRTEIPLREVVADITVIDRAQIDRQAGSAVADLLRTVPGLQVSRSGGPAGTTNVFIRGGEARFTAVLIDGVRVDTQTTGGFRWEAIPLSQIDRIEVLRGPASAVYGSDAISGVIQIFTRRGQPGTQVDVGMGGASFGTFKTDAAVMGQVGAFDYALSGLSERSTGYDGQTDAARARNRDRDGYRSTGGSGRLGWSMAEGQRLEVSAVRSHVDGGYDASPATHADDRSVNGVDSLSAKWTAQWMKSWRSTVSLGQAKDHYATHPDLYATDTRVRTASWQNDLKLGSHTLSAVLERREDELENSDVASDVNARKQDAAGLGWGWRHAGYALQANARHDRNDVFGSVNTGSFGAGAELGAGWRVQTSVSNGFRAPTVYQQFSSYGKPALQPERSRSNVDLGLQYRAGGFESSATVYRNRVTNLISFGPPGMCISPDGCYDNIGNALIKGITLTSAYATDDLRLSAAVDILSAKNLDNGAHLARRAPRSATLTLDKTLGDTTVGAEWQAVAKRYDNMANTAVLGGYSIVNLQLQHRLNAEWRLVARADNFFDKEYQLASRYVTNPQTVFVGVRWSPKIGG